MKLSDLAVSPERIEAGAWVDNIPDMGDLRLKVRGVNNSDWRKITSTMLKAVPRAKRLSSGGIDLDEQDRITSACLQSACLLDWGNLTGDDGKLLPYSKEVARDLLTKPEFRAFRDAVFYAATIVGDQAASNLEADAKNSPTP